jgi:hypothetical protein
MIETLLAYLTTTLAGKATIATLGLWALGFFAKSAAYRKVREWLGKAAYQAGAALSGLATSRLGRPTWGPLEAVLTDYAGFGIEQFMAGLRSDNVEKLEAQVERLEAVGSVTRAAALADKAEVLKASAAPVGRHAERR